MSSPTGPLATAASESGARKTAPETHSLSDPELYSANLGDGSKSLSILKSFEDTSPSGK